MSLFSVVDHVGGSLRKPNLLGHHLMVDPVHQCVKRNGSESPLLCRFCNAMHVVQQLFDKLTLLKGHFGMQAFEIERVLRVTVNRVVGEGAVWVIRPQQCNRK